MRALLLASLLLVTASPATAQLTNLPTLTQPVNDTAGVIDADSARELERRIRALREATGDVITVTTVPSIAPYASVEEYAVKLFEKAGIGKRKLDNGLLVLVAVKEHGIRIEVGYGLEGIVTDGFAGDTIRKLIVPEFKANRYGAGLIAGTTHLIDRITEGRANPGAPGPKPAEAFPWAGLVLLVIICLTVIGVILFVISRIAKATGGARDTPAASGMLGSDWGSSSDSSSSSSDSGSSSSDSSGFDGGSSGGGGASGSW